MFYRISSLERDCISVRQFAVYEFSIQSVIPDRWLWIRIWRVVIVYVLHAACIIKCSLCAKCSFRKKTVFVRICFCMHPLFTHPKNSVKSASCKSFWQIFHGVYNTYLGFGLNLKINDRTCPQTSKNSWSEKWWLVQTQLCLVLYPLSNSKFVEGQLGVHRPANSFGKKSRENKACTAALHNCTPCSHASDVSQLFAHAKSLSDSWWFNKDRLCTSASK